MIGLPDPRQTAANTPEALPSYPGRLGDRDAPFGGSGTIDLSAPPHTAAVTFQSLRPSVGRFGGRDSPWGCRVQFPASPHTAADTPESLRTCLGRSVDRDAPSGVGQDCTFSSSPHNGGDTLVRPVLPGLFGGYGRPVGAPCAMGFPTPPTRRRIHQSSRVLPSSFGG